jgi:hypothetical protein
VAAEGEGAREAEGEARSGPWPRRESEGSAGEEGAGLVAGCRSPSAATALDGVSEGEADELGAVRGGVPVARDQSVLRSGWWAGGQAGDRESVKEGDGLAPPRGRPESVGPAEERGRNSAP